MATAPEFLQSRFTRREITFGLALIALSLAGCDIPDSGQQPSKKPSSPLPPATNTPTPQPTDILTPKTIITGASVLLYKQGVVVNATSGIDVEIAVDELQRINVGTGFGISLNPEEQNITYLFPQTFRDYDQKQRALMQVEEELPLVLSALIRNLGISRGRTRFSAISVADALTQVVQKNPRIPLTDSFLRPVLGVELSHAYIGLSAAKIYEVNKTPGTYPEISSTLRSIVAQTGSYPIGVSGIDQNYLIALNLFRSRVI